MSVKSSTGLTTINRLNQILNILTANGKMPEQMAYKILRRIPESIADLVNAKIPQGQKTIFNEWAWIWTCYACLG